MRLASRLLPCLAALLTLAVGGCADPSGVRKVTGTATLDNAPLAGAHIQLVPADRSETHLGEFGGYTSADGNFEITLGANTGRIAQPGRFVVLITKGAGIGASTPPSDLKDEDRIKELMKMGPGTGRGTLPAIYSDRDHCPFKVELVEGANEVGPLQLRTKTK